MQPNSEKTETQVNVLKFQGSLSVKIWCKVDTEISWSRSPKEDKMQTEAEKSTINNCVQIYLFVTQIL